MDEILKAYRDRWQAIAEVERGEQQTASLESRWQQLNAVVGMAIALGILKPANDEIEGQRRWANLQEKASRQHLPVSIHS